MNKTIISWTELTWNVWSGCTKISPGCKNCYACTIAENKRGTKAFPNGFDLTYRWHRLYEPLKVKEPHFIFVNSMSDLYWEQVNIEDIKRVFEVMNMCEQHKFQILTKRSQRLAAIARELNWTANIWQGVSVENKDYLWRVDDLRSVDAAVKFISFEPLLGPIPYLDLRGIDWVIVGGESGSNYRPMDHAWAREIRDACVQQGVAFFFKQSAAYRTEIGTELKEEDGTKRTWTEMPLVKLGRVS